METIIFTRQQLYELVWKEPIVSIAKRLNISDYEIRKASILMKIPLPVAGYWQKVKSNKKVKVKELDKSYRGTNEISFNIKQANGLVKQTPLNTQIDKVKGENDLYKVFKELTNPDKLVLSAKESIEERLRRRFSSNGIIRSGYDQIEINVVEKNVDRALRITDAIIKSLRYRGYTFEMKDRFSYAKLGDVEFRICCRDILKKVINKTSYGYDRTDFVPAGTLSFKVERYSRTFEFKDGKVSLENQVPTILAKIDIAHKEISDEINYHQAQREHREKQELIEREIRLTNEKEIARFQNLLKKAEEWQRIEVIKNYVMKIEELALSGQQLPQEVLDKVRWAKTKISEFNPINKFLED
ncbi:hypothetical protein [Pedobacter helvus]|uniref:Uncharacterized protein n=1 Tax=Pedobacter helvus TaxID=2563444 RepID=A0ABW9JG38_9SPHI|nr:hypothetical protein [Pedobacter ureilyticus]